MRMLQTQNSYFERFTQQISSVSTEQPQAGVKSSVKSRMRKSRSRKSSWQKKWAATEECKHARSKFFGANSMEWWSSIWKQIERMSSEFRNTGEKHPLCKSLRRYVILEKSLYWNVLQDHCRRRWWFWRSNSSMPRVHTPSCWFRFQNLCRSPKTNCNWTSYSSSYYKISWHSRNW